MAQTFFLHVGTRKSGTSYLQRTAVLSASELAEQGVALPFDLRVKARGRIPATVVALEDPPSQEDREKLTRWRRRVANSDGDRAFFSAEALAAVRDPQLSTFLDAFEGIDTHILITARDLSRQVPSEWQQAAKALDVPDYPTFCEEVRDNAGRFGPLFRNRQYIPEIAAAWGRSLPPENVHIVIHPRARRDPEWLPREFFGLLGVDHRMLTAPSSFTNASLSFAEAELLRRSVALIATRREYAMGDLLAVIRRSWTPPPGLPDEQLALPRSLHRWCQQEAEQEIEAIRAGGWHVVGNLEDLLVPDDVALLDPDRVPVPDLDGLAEQGAKLLEDGLDALDQRRSSR